MCCSTLAMMGIREPRGKVLVSAGPEKSSVVSRGSFSPFKKQQLPFVRVGTMAQIPLKIHFHIYSPYVNKGSLPTIHDPHMEHQICLTKRIKHWVINPREPVFGPVKGNRSNTFWTVCWASLRVQVRGRSSLTSGTCRRHVGERANPGIHPAACKPGHWSRR